MIHIRLCTSEDLPALAPLYRDFFALHRQFLGNTEPLADAEAREIAQDALNQAQSWIIAAEDGQTGQLIGFARWEEREGAVFGREIFVHPDHRGRGLGTRLQTELERRARENGADAIFIAIVPHNQHMLDFAHRRGYDTLNTIELRKELAEERPRRDQVTLFGLEFRII
jgi:GNAT superfamily N-acetyltransferase